MKKRAKITAFLTFLSCSVYMIIFYSGNVYNFFIFTHREGINSEEFHYKTHVLYTEGCKVPKFDPFDPTVVKYYTSVTEGISCKGKQYLKIFNNVVILDKEAVDKDFADKNFSCTYRAIHRNPKNKTSRADNKFGYGGEKILIFNETLPDEFIKASCTVEGNVIYEEFLASTPIKPSVEERCNKYSSRIVALKPLNVIVVGIDSISKLNFERHFKRTAKYLCQNMSTFEFHGYMKVADNTLPNLTPMLTGHFLDHYFTESNRGRYFDDLDFIWKNFSSIGYRTLFAEDAPDMGTFNYVKNGFQFPPTDYFFRPFTLAIEDSPWQEASNVDCFQAKPEIVALFDYLRSFLSTMGEKPYFAFTWNARLTHGKLNKAGYADKPTLDLLKDINDMGLLNKSVFIFMSDHGIRFGDIRKTLIGKIEERMPFMFMSLPNWFLAANDNIKANLIVNQRKLTTPFDLHETLVDIYQATSGDLDYVRTPYGISLFREIPAERNCTSAYIKPHWCVCHNYKELDPNSQSAVEAARALLTILNDMTYQHRNVCAELQLNAILDARIAQPEKDLLRYEELKHGEFENSIVYNNNFDVFQKVMVTIRTTPGNAEFESSLGKFNETYEVFDISRINMYGHQSACVNDSTLRKYCYCKIN